MPEDARSAQMSPKPLASGAARLRERKRKAGLLGSKSGWLILAILVIFGAGVVMSGGGRNFLHFLYGPVAIIVVIFMIVEYIVLKGRDRSRIYRLELEQTRERRRHDVEFLQSVEEQLRQIEEALGAVGADQTVDAPSAASPPESDAVNQAKSRLTALRKLVGRRL